MHSASTSSSVGICPSTSSPATNQNMPSAMNFSSQQRCQQPSSTVGQQSTPLTASTKDSSRDYSGLHLEMFELLCTFHRVKRIQSKDTTQCGQLIQDIGLSNEQRAELVNKSMYKILNEIEAKIIILPNTTEPVNADYFDEWSFLAWALLLIINRLEAMDAQEIALLDYGGKHFQEKIHAALVDLVNKAHRMQPPPTVQSNDQQFDRFYQAYVTALISLHELYTMSQRNDRMMYSEFEAHIGHFKKQMVACFVLQREFANCHGFMIWRQLREHQIRKMTHFGYENKGFLDSTVSFYAHMLYNLGVLAARLQGFSYELRGSKAAIGELVKPLLAMVYQMADVLLSDSIICLEPSQNPILVTNNLFPMKIVSLCRFSFFRDFSLQIVSEEVAQQIQQEMRHRKTFDPPSPIRKTQTAALLAMKPATGVKRNNAKASEEGGNTAHKKSDVNSKEWISIPPIFDAEHVGWCATYPHLLCTTRQKDTLLETRSAMQTGKRPLFYFHVRAELFSFSGGFSTAHTLSLPFTIATRRNQDCQVQRMMSSYTATCFWLYGTNVLDGLLIQWFDGEIEWKHFKLLYSLYFAMNAEVMRTFTDEDFNILQQKMHCPECTENSTNQQIPLARISFKNVLCPHLHFSAAKCDLRFSVWRGMLELLHLFNDQKTETRNLWEAGLLQGFLELKTVHSMLRTLPGSGLVMRLSLVAGACVCITVKCFNGELLDLEPLDVKRLQAKNLHDFLKDIILAEKVDFVLDSNKEWVHVAEVMKRCQKCSSPGDQVPSQPKTREVLSNAMHPGPVEKEHRISFTTMRIAVVTCKANTADNNNEPDDEFGEHSNKVDSVDDGGFEQNLEQLLRTHGKTPEQAMEILSRMAQQRRNNNNNNNNNAQQIHFGAQMGAVQPSAPIQSDQKMQNPPTFYLSVPLAQDGPSPSHMAQSNPAPSSIGQIPPSSTPSSSFSTALASSVEDSYPSQRHHQNQQQHQLYFGTNSTPMPTMNMPIVVMPAHSQHANSSSFMLFPATPNSAPTIMTIGTLNDQQMAHPSFSATSTNANNPLLHSHAFQIGSIQSTSNAPTTSSSFHSSIHQNPHSHSHHRHLVLANNSPIAIVHQSPQSQSQSQSQQSQTPSSQYQNSITNDQNQQQHSQMPQHSADQPQQSTQFPPQINM